MKIRNLFIALAMAACAVPLGVDAAAKGRVVVNPRWQAANTRDYDITSVTLTDTATVVKIDAYYRPGWWIRWDTSTHLVGGGKKYMIKRAEGIELNSEHYMPASGKDSFVFYFEPLDRRVRVVDLIEGEPDDFFKIWGIDLGGGKRNFAPAKEIPEAVRKLSLADATLPTPELKAAMSSLRVKVAGYRRELNFKPTLEVLGMIPTPKESYAPTTVGKGEWLFEFPLFGPSMVYFQTGRGMGTALILEPGAENNVWIDLAAWANKVAPDDEVQPWLYSDGRYGAFNMAGRNNFSVPRGFSIGFHDEMLSRLVDKPREEIFPAFRTIRDDMIASVDTLSKLPALAKEVLKSNLMRGYLGTIDGLDQALAYQRVVRSGAESPTREDINKARIAFTPDDYREAYRGIDFNDPRLIYAASEGRAFGSLNAYPEVRSSLGADGTLVGNLLTVKRAVKELEGTGAMSVETTARIEAIEDSFFRDALTLRADYIEQMKRNAPGGSIVRDVPEGVDVFDQIVARYKGSPVMVDFWATWCGPCRMSIRDTKEMKEKLMDEGAVFVYITGETSPKATWESAILDIKGEHYRLSDEQWKVLYERFHVDGIPFYVMVGRDGSINADTSMRDHHTWEEVIRGELEKK